MSTTFHLHPSPPENQLQYTVKRYLKSVKFHYHGTLSKKEVAADQKNIEALDKAWLKLINRSVWGVDPDKLEVREHHDVRNDALRTNKQVHFGTTFGLVVITHSELNKNTGCLRVELSL